jgi:hypothetical protein
MIVGYASDGFRQLHILMLRGEAWPHGWFIWPQRIHCACLETFKNLIHSAYGNALAGSLDIAGRRKRGSLSCVKTWQIKVLPVLSAKPENASDAHGHRCRLPMTLSHAAFMLKTWVY